jgi:hypothetical protein
MYPHKTSPKVIRSAREMSSRRYDLLSRVLIQSDLAHVSRFLLNGVSRVNFAFSRVRGCKTNPYGLTFPFICCKKCGVEILIFIIAGSETHLGWPSIAVAVSASTDQTEFLYHGE